MIAVYYILADCSWAPSQWLQELPRDKRQQVLALRDPRDRWRTLAGLQLLKRGCRELGFAGFRLADLRFSTGDKPRWRANPDFSIAHSGDLVGCAINSSGSVGLDIEELRVIHAEQFRLYLTLPERAWASRDPGRFFSLWTRKESVVKARGAGLPQVRDVELREHGAGFSGRDWYTHHVDLAPGYSACVATDASGGPPSISVRELQLETLCADTPDE